MKNMGRNLAVAVAILMVATGCGTSRTKQASDEGLSIMQQARPGLNPQEKVRVASELINHAGRYHALFQDASIQEKREILRSKLSEMEAAAAVLCSAADDYKKLGQDNKARDIYWLILRSFTGDAYSATRRNAEAELRYMDELLRRKEH